MSVGQRFDLPRRAGVDLLEARGVEPAWSMPVALWHAPNGFDTRQTPENKPYHTIAIRLSGSLVQHYRTPSGLSERLHPEGFSVHPAFDDLHFLAPSAIRFVHLYTSDDFLRLVLQEVRGAGDQDAPVVRRDHVMYRDLEWYELNSLSRSW